MTSSIVTVFQNTELGEIIDYKNQLLGFSNTKTTDLQNECWVSSWLLQSAVN